MLDWKKNSIDSEGFYTSSYVLKSNQGSDHIVLIRKIIKQCVFSLENMHDTIIWLTCKLVKCLCQSPEDVYLGCVYISLNSLISYQIYDWYWNQIVEYMKSGKIMLIDDTNAKT